MLVKVLKDTKINVKLLSFWQLHMVWEGNFRIILIIFQQAKTHVIALKLELSIKCFVPSDEEWVVLWWTEFSEYWRSGNFSGKEKSWLEGPFVWSGPESWVCIFGVHKTKSKTKLWFILRNGHLANWTWFNHAWELWSSNSQDYLFSMEKVFCKLLQSQKWFQMNGFLPSECCVRFINKATAFKFGRRIIAQCWTLCLCLKMILLWG